MSTATYHVGDVFEQLAKIPDGSVDLVCGSPPFLALRSYLPADHPDKAREIGSEPTPAVFLSTLLALTREWRRVLAPHGSIAVELGDTYSGAAGYGDPDSVNPAYGAKDGERYKERYEGRTAKRFKRKDDGWPEQKSLCGIPTLYAWSLAYGRNLLDPADTIDPWRIRNVVVWHRPNPPVGALGDKVRPSTSYITVATVAQDRWFDLDAERTESVWQDHRNKYAARYDGTGKPKHDDRADGGKYTSSGANPAGAPPLDCWFDTDDGDDVWTIPTQPYAGAHYATWPIRLASRLVNLMCPRQVCTVCGEPRRRLTSVEYVGTTTRRNGSKANASVAAGVSQGHHALAEVNPIANRSTLGWSDCGHDSWRNGITLDPFAGSGTTLAAASGLGRDSIGIDLDPRNLDLARARVGMFLVEGAA
jgi:hypothetical protein